ncbi:acyl-CoA transferase [Saccharomonospora sp. CUA-673]|uniref:CaiB/BaiF CoA transferase family protein n=1 Tax=Saccharomonospora sp. CUA-673 TaxID=1904969 RepID=UPI000968004C|nr:CaiB/BaiF CoA-transferase family protein [Saccharomonospora sp. CUA-673]OLT39011.1 acyl-CoA transferase [Saccharomonospora sp. CUA-673]
MSGGLLDGVRVLDLTNVLAGPYASYQLGLFGADVVKIETPGSGDLARQLGADAELNEAHLGTSFLAQNGGKRSLTLNLKTGRGKEVFAELVRGSDVVLENFRPGVLARLGFDHDRLAELNPRLVYCAISGFGQDGPMADRPAYDQIIQGLSGMMSVTGTSDAAPLRAGYPITDTLGGMAAAFAVCAALSRAERTGEGAHLDLSMMDTAMTAMGWAMSNYLIAGVEPRAMGNENATAAPSGTFRTADGHLNIAANKQEQFETLCAQIGRPELATDARFAAREDRKARRSQLREELEVGLRTQPAEHWERALSAAGVPAARVLDVPDVLALDQVRARELVHELPFPGRDDATTVRVLGSGVRVGGKTAAPGGPPPLLGEHTDELLADLGYDADQITELREAGVV